MAETPLEPNATSIEALFRPSARLRDSHALPYGFTELELLPGLTVENVLATGVTWDEFHRFLYHKVVWMTLDVYVCSNGLYLGGALRVLSLGGRGRTHMSVHVTPDTAAAAATTTCDFMVRLLATYEKHDVYINGCSDGASTPLSGAALSLFFQESPSCLREVLLWNLVLDADLCQALATMSRLDVELTIHVLCCSLADDAAGAFVECLQGDKSPVKLIDCTIDRQILASGLTGNSRVTKLKLLDSGRANNADTAVLFATLANNRGLVDLDLYCCSINEDNWSILCESLQAHPTLTKLDLSHTGRFELLTDNQKTHRTRMLADMVQRNTSLHTIILSELCQDARDEEIYAQMILPCLETNRYRPRVHAIKKADISLRRPLLGRALQTESVRNDSNLRWMFLSGNADVVVRPN